MEGMVILLILMCLFYCHANTNSQTSLFYIQFTYNLIQHVGEFLKTLEEGVMVKLSLKYYIITLHYNQLN